MSLAPYVLIVEDDLVIAHGISSLLQSSGFRTRLAPNGADALRILEAGEPDLIIMDIHLEPGPDGITLAREIGREHNVPIIFLTGDRTEQHYQDAISTVPYLFIRKPFPDAELVSLVSMAIRFTAKNKNGEPRKEVWINKNSREPIKVYLPDIYYVQSKGSYTAIYLFDKDQQKNDTITLVKSSNHILEELAFPHLIKVHRSFHINLLRMERYAEHKVHSGGQLIPVSRAYRSLLQEAIAKL